MTKLGLTQGHFAAGGGPKVVFVNQTLELREHLRSISQKTRTREAEMTFHDRESARFIAQKDHRGRPLLLVAALAFSLAVWCLIAFLVFKLA